MFEILKNHFFAATVAVIFTVVRVGQAVHYFWNARPRIAAAGEAEFNAANKLITTTGIYNAFGNNPKAVAFAEAYSKKLEEITKKAFSGGNPGVLGELSTNGKVLVYCQLSEKHCTFIAQMPELRQYDDDALESLKKLSWLVAQVVAKPDDDKPIELAVGLRGIILYGPVLFGKSNLGKPLLEAQGIDGMKMLYPLFAPQIDVTTSTSTSATTATESLQSTLPATSIVPNVVPIPSKE